MPNVFKRTLALALCCSSAVYAQTPAEEESARVEAFVKKWGPEGRGVLQLADPSPESWFDGPFDSLFNIINQITGTWQNIVNAFKSSYTEQIADKEFNNGWSKFKAATRAFKGAGLGYANADEFFVDIKQMIQLPAEYSDDFDKQLQWIKFFDNITWSSHNTQFNIGKGGDDKQFTMFARNRQDDMKLDVFFLTCSETFEKADNYFVISESRSILGGIWSSTKLKIKKIPAGLTDADLTFVSDYFQLMAYQQIALAAGMEVPPDPQFPPSAAQTMLSLV